MANANRTRAINELYKFIWSLSGKCDGIAKINDNLIWDYSRFSVMASELSLGFQKNIEKMTEDEYDFSMKKYEKFNKIALQLYKTLKFEQIKDELADYGNPFNKLFQEAEKDGDF